MITVRYDNECCVASICHGSAVKWLFVMGSIYASEAPVMNLQSAAEHSVTGLVVIGKAQNKTAADGGSLVLFIANVRAILAS